MTPLEPHVRRLLEWMPKAELHLHLDGSLRTNTAIELAQQHDIDAPRTWRDMFHALVAPEHPGSQAELLKAFDLPIALMQWPDAMVRIAAELVEDKARDNVRFMEVKWAPAFHTQQGMSLDDVIRAVGEGAAEAGARCGVEVRLNVVAIRAHTPELNVAVAEAAVRCRDAGVTGFDFAGYEAANPDPTPHAQAFEVAASLCFQDGAKRAGVSLLEPIMKNEVVVPEQYMGDVIGDINSRRGRILGMNQRGNAQVVDSEVPLATMFGYVTDLRSMTQGRATSSMHFSHYAPVPAAVQEEVVAKVKGA